MASPRNRPPDSLERSGAQRVRQRGAAEQSHILHHSDDELFSARVSALIAERQLLLRQGLIRRLQHLKVAILSSELNDHHESAEQKLLPSERDRGDSPTQQHSPSLLLRPGMESMAHLHSHLDDVAVQRPSRASTDIGQGASDSLREEPTTKRRSYPARRVAFMHRDLETGGSDTNQAERTVLSTSPAMTPSDHERTQMPPHQHSDPWLTYSTPSLPESASEGIASTTSLESPFPPSAPLPEGCQSLDHSGTESFAIQSSPPVSVYEDHTRSDSLEARRDKPPTVLPRDSEDASHNVEYERKGQSVDFALHSIGASGSQELATAGAFGFHRDDELPDALQHHVETLPTRDRSSDYRSSTDQGVVIDPKSNAAHTTPRSPPLVSSRSATTEGHVSLASPLLRFEVQLFSSFAADMNKSIESGRWHFREALVKHQDGAETHTDSLASPTVQRDTGSDSRARRNLLQRDMLPHSSSLRLNSLYPYIPKLTHSEFAAIGNPSASLSGQHEQSPCSLDAQFSNILSPSHGVTPSLTLLSMAFFDQELKLLIDNNFRLSHVPRDESFLEAVRISEQISCTLAQQHQEPLALKHIVPSGQESQFLTSLDVEPELDISNSSTSLQWISDLQKFLGKVRTPVLANFQRRTYFNMSEHDERRAPTAMWHFDIANSSQHAEELTELSQAQSHVAYGTATDTRRYSSYYSNRGVHSSPGDTTVALNFGFQTRTNYPFRKTYRHSHKRGEVSHETRPISPAGDRSHDALCSAEFSAQALIPACQGALPFNAIETGSTLRDASRAGDKAVVYSISEEGKLIGRKDK